MTEVCAMGWPQRVLAVCFADFDRSGTELRIDWPKLLSTERRQGPATKLGRLSRPVYPERTTTSQ